MRFLLALAFTVLFTTMASSITINVPADEPTIQAGVNVANTDDTVLVAPGTYNENVEIMDWRIAVIGSEGPDSTIIQASDISFATVKIEGASTRGTLISGFTISGSSMTGIYCNITSPIIKNNIITDNYNSGADQIGSAIDMNSTSGSLITENIICGNTSGHNDETVLFQNAVSDTFSYNIVHSNSCAGDVTGSASEVTLVNNTISISGTYGIVVDLASTFDLKNNIIFNAPNWSIFVDSNDGSSAIADYNCFYNNGNNYSGGVVCTNSINQDPCFSDTSGNNYSLENYSPCIDAGNPAPIYYDPNGTRNDVGAIYNEFIPSVKRIPLDYPTIQDGINAAVNGDTVLVEFGIWAENLSFAGKAIILISEEGASETTIRPLTNDPTIRLVNGEHSSAKIIGFTFDTAMNDQIQLRNGASVTIENNVFTNFGQVHLLDSASAFLKDNLFYSFSGAIPIRSENNSIIHVERNVFCNNSDICIYFMHASSGSIINNTMDSNNRGIFVSSSNNVIAKNNTITNSSLFGVGGSNIESNYNNIWNNLVNYDIGASPGASDISQNPHYLNPTIMNFNLSPTSPCIDAGDPTSPVPEGGGERIDIGAFEYKGLALEFSLYLPSDEEVVFSHHPSFTWQSLPDTTDYGLFAYEIVIDDSIIYDNPIVVSGIADTTYTITSSLPSTGVWYWKVKGYNDTTVFWSNETFEFRIDNLPLTPVVISPENNAEAQPSDWLIWSESYDADEDDTVTYTLEIDNSSDFLSLEVTEEEISSEAIPPITGKSGLVGIQLMDLDDFSNLLDDTEYFWRVKAVDKFGGESDFSDGTAYFTYNNSNSVPSPPSSGFAPSEQTIVNNLLPTISWYPGTDPDPSDDATTLKYYLHLDDDGEFDTTIQYTYETLPGISSFFVSDSLTDEALWYYAIQTIDDEGAESGFSITQAFWTNSSNDGPVQFSLISPVSGWLYEMLPTFVWDNSTDSDPLDTVRYSLYIALDEDFNFSSEISSISDTFSVSKDSLDFGDEYWWKVKAYDTCDSTVWSSEINHIQTWVLGDANSDGQCNIGDAVFLINYIFNSGPSPVPDKTGDINGDCSVNIGDAVYIINYVFKGGASPLVGCSE